MDPVRRQTIVSEIERWRDSKLLPEHYCDFLLNLYVDDKKTAGPKSNKLVLFLISGFISLILIVSLYFISFHPLLQISLFLLSLCVFYGIGLRIRKSNPVLSYISLGSASIFMIFIGEFMLKLHGLDSPAMVVVLVALSGIAWMIIGLAADVVLLHFCGWICVLMAYTWLIQRLHPQPEWMTLQLYVVPVCAVLFFIGKGWAVSHRSAGIVLISVSLLFFLVPEIYGLLFTDISGIILQPALVLKIIITGVIGWPVWKNPKPTEWMADHD